MNGELFFIVGFTIFVGYLSSLFSQRTRISEVLLLILFGFLIGPVLGFVDTASSSIIVQILPIVSTLALIVLLFDGGIEFNLRSVARAIPRSTAYAIIVFAISAVLSAVFMSIALGWPLIQGIMFGAVIGGTSSAIVIAMAEKLDVISDTKATLTVESTITDALSIIVAIVILRMILESTVLDLGQLANTMLGSFTIAIFLGGFSAISWILISHRFLLNKYNYMLTLALVFGLYAVTEAVGANGGIAVFVFGVVLGNAKNVNNLLHIRIEKPVDPKVKVFQEEITFFVRTFFFVYIGLLLSPQYFTGTVIFVSICLLGLLFLARWVSTKLIFPELPDFDSKIARVMMPRGLAAAVLATFPLASGLVLENFQEIVFSIILLTNIAATAGVFALRKRPQSDHERLKQTLEEAEKEHNEAEKKIEVTKKMLKEKKKEIKEEEAKEKEEKPK